MAAVSGAQPSALAVLRPLTSLVGRDDAIASITSLLDAHRLVTLLGSGGCGKTRLAIEVSTRVEDSFPGGVAFADLAPITEDDRVANVVASSFAIPEVAPTTVADSIAASLAARRCLLVLDNCERVADGCADLVHSLLTRCAGLVVLATSRVPLGVDGELTWMVPSLSLPSRGEDNPAVALRASESGRLLLDRSHLPDDAVAQSAAALVDICHKLDGIPLALELSATRVRALGAGEVCRGLEHRFSLLTSRSRLVPPRQRTLEASIDWSYELLSGTEQLLFRRLAVFAGRFDVVDIETVCTGGGIDVADTRTVLAGLVDHSLVWLDHDPARPGYRVPDSTRQFALDRLIETGDADELRNRHLRWVLDVAAEVDDVADGARLESVTGAIDPRIDEVRSALDWAVRGGRIGDGLRLASRLRPLWIFRNRIREGLDWFTRLLEVDQAAGSVDLQARISGLLAAAHLYLYADDSTGRDEELADEAVALTRQVGDRRLEARALLFTAWPKVLVDPTAARQSFSDALAAAEACDDDREVINASWGLGWTATTAGDLTTAVDVLDSGLVRARDRGSLGLRYGLTMRGYAAILRAELARADDLLSEAAACFSPGADRFNADRVAMWQGLSAMLQGRYETASALLEAVVTSAAEVGIPPMFGPLQLGLLRWATGDGDRAVPVLTDALDVFAEMGHPTWFQVQALVALADLAADPGERRRWLDEAEALAACGNPLARVAVSLTASRGHVGSEDHEQAAAAATDALRVAHDIGYRIGVIDAADVLALIPGSDQPRWLASVDAERARCGYARFPIRESDHQTAVDSVGQLPTATSLDELIAATETKGTLTDRPATGWASLTPAELRVADLVAEGLTNPEIGEKLFISRRTVQAHLSHIFTKLDISNRAQLAAVVTEHGDGRG